MADAITIAQTGVDPRTGSYLSAEARKALFRRATVSSSVFRGRGGALVRQDRNDLASTQSLAIVKANQSSLGTISKQIEFVRVEVLNLTNGVRDIAKLLRGESIAEQRRIQQDQDNEQKIVDRDIKRGRENELEKKIQNALISPVKKVIEQTEGIFDRIKRALYILLGGWFTLQGIELLRAYKDKNFKVFDEIKNSILKNLLYAGAGLLAINVGFAVFLRLLNGVVFKVGGLIARLITLPFRGLGALGRGVAGLFSRGAPAAANAARSGRPLVTGSTNLMTKFFNFMRGGGGAAAARGGGRIAGGFTPGVGTFLGGVSTAYDLSQGDIPGAALSALSMLPVVGGFAALGRVGLEVSRVAGGGQKPTPTSSTPQQQLKPVQPTIPSSQTPAVTPATPMTPGGTGELNMNIGTSAAGINPTEEEKGYMELFKSIPQNTIPIMPGEERESDQASQQAASITPNSTEAKISQKQTENAPLGPITKPPPQVVLTQPQTKQEPPTPSLSKSMVNDIPNISSSNPNNFYIMYSQLSYNVVM